MPSWTLPKSPTTWAERPHFLETYLKSQGSKCLNQDFRASVVDFYQNFCLLHSFVRRRAKFLCSYPSSIRSGAEQLSGSQPKGPESPNMKSYCLLKNSEGLCSESRFYNTPTTPAFPPGVQILLGIKALACALYSQEIAGAAVAQSCRLNMSR